MRKLSLLPYTGLQWAIGILKMIVFETIESMVENGGGNTEYVQPGTMVLGVDEYQGNHSNAVNLVEFVNNKFPTI